MGQQKTGRQNMGSLSFYEYCEKPHREQPLNGWDAKRKLPYRSRTTPWDYERPAFWPCENGHRWHSNPETTICNNGHGSGSSGMKLHWGVNDLQALYPELAIEWNEERNVPVAPDRVRQNSKETCWWTCPNGHIWEASARERIESETCPYCSGLDMAGKKLPFSLAYPKRSAQWDTPWQAVIANRAGIRKSGCPYCVGKRAWAGFDNLTTTCPQSGIQD